MTDEDIKDALDGLFAYDTGCVDSGIKDERLRARVIAELNKDWGSDMYSKRLARIAREMFLTDEAIELGYGLQDLRQFLEWIDEQFEIDW